MKKFNLVIVLAIVIAVGAIGAAVYFNKHGINLTTKKAVQLVVGEDKVDAVGKNAFGSLSGSASAPVGAGGQEEAIASRSAMSNNASTTVAPSALSSYMTTPAGEPGYGAGGAPASDMKFAPPYYSPYKFVYKGEKLELNETEGDVFKRIKNLGGSGPITEILKTVSFGLLDLNSFQNLAVQSFTLMEDKDFGYIVTVNSREGSVYISENWERWQTPDRNCQDEKCFNQTRLKPEDMPADDVVVAIVNKFFDDYGIARGSYGQPVVQKYWSDPVIMRQEKMISPDIYVPDTVSVIYPLKIQGQAVSDESGNSTGLYVSVNVRQKKVSGVSELYSPNYQSSEYPLETDAARILKFAERGGGYGGYWDESGFQKNLAEVYLGTPTRALIRVWVYNQNNSQELFVPALVFPVTGSSNKDLQYYQKQVVVPLAKEILDQREKYQVPPYPIPLDANTTMSIDPAPPVGKPIK